MKPADSDAPRVVVFALGGTIAATGSGGVSPSLSADQLVSAVPGLAATGVTVEVEDFRKLPGTSLSFEDLTALVDAIRARTAQGVDGVVVTQGTDTIEESAYYLDLLHDGPHPVVVTGAMRNPTLAGADGPANILAAIQVAASPDARYQGCVVVFADEIHAARRVRKTHSTSGHTFQSPNGGPLGYVVEGRPRFLNALGGRFVVPAAHAAVQPTVGLVTVTLGDDGTMLEQASRHLDGLVVAAFGAGHVPVALVPLLAQVAERIPVVLASRTGGGSVLASRYGFPGSESDLLNRGLISAGFLDPLKARVLLRTLLTAGGDRDAIAAAFGAAGGYREPADWPWPLDRHQPA
ncbi:MAG: asparaginase [Mycobacteriales bacterium]